jgi:hypothetical protein
MSSSGRPFGIWLRNMFRNHFHPLLKEDIMLDGDRVVADDSIQRVSGKEDAHWIVVVVGGVPGRCSL